jgi:hypothetical protein
MSNTSLLTESTVTIHYIGHEALNLPTVGLTDHELLKEAAKEFPKGLNLMGSNLGPVWVHPTMLLNLAQPDGFGLELQGLAHSAAELLRLAADPEKADELTGKGIDRMIALFAAQAHGQAIAKRPNQLHAHRWGAAAKVAGADRVTPGMLEIHPEGNVAARLAQLFGCVPGATGGWADLEGRQLMLLRHPFILGYVVTIGFNENLTKNLTLVNRLDGRRATGMDFDGDQVFLFAIKSRIMAAMIDAEIKAVVPDNDATKLVLGKPCEEPGGEWWGELLEKSTEQKLDQHFTKTIGEWINSHITMGDYANKFTPFAYRISDIGGAMAAVGIPGAREMSLIGATIEETFYLGLSGGPKELDEAMETWFRKKMSAANQRILFAGLRTVVNPDLLANADVRTAIARGSAINGGRFDDCNPQELLVHTAFLVGKGKLTLGSGVLLDQLALIASEPTLSAELRESFVARMLFHAARKLHQVVGKGNPIVGETPSDDYEADGFEEYTSDFEE